MSANLVCLKLKSDVSCKNTLEINTRKERTVMRKISQIVTITMAMLVNMSVQIENPAFCFAN
jgi:hypothetical protein